MACIGLIRQLRGRVLGPWIERQTPQRYLYEYRPWFGALLWGIDTGAVFTTFRVTLLSWVAVVLALLGRLPTLAGAAFAAGFLIPLVLFITLPGDREGSILNARNPLPYMRLVQKSQRSVGWIAILVNVLVAGALWAGVS
jgi:hypothetical protein